MMSKEATREVAQQLWDAGREHGFNTLWNGRRPEAYPGEKAACDVHYEDVVRMLQVIRWHDVRFANAPHESVVRQLGGGDCGRWFASLPRPAAGQKPPRIPA